MPTKKDDRPKVLAPPSRRVPQSGRGGHYIDTAVSGTSRGRAGATPFFSLRTGIEQGGMFTGTPARPGSDIDTLTNQLFKRYGESHPLDISDTKFISKLKKLAKSKGLLGIAGTIGAMSHGKR